METGIPGFIKRYYSNSNIMVIFLLYKLIVCQKHFIYLHH